MGFDNCAELTLRIKCKQHPVTLKCDPLTLRWNRQITAINDVARN